MVHLRQLLVHILMHLKMVCLMFYQVHLLLILAKFPTDAHIAWLPCETQIEYPWQLSCIIGQVLQHWQPLYFFHHPSAYGNFSTPGVQILSCHAMYFNHLVNGQRIIENQWNSVPLKDPSFHSLVFKVLLGASWKLLSILVQFYK